MPQSLVRSRISRRPTGLVAISALVVSALAFSVGPVEASQGGGGVVWGPDTLVSTAAGDVSGASLVYDISKDGQTVVAMWARRNGSNPTSFDMQLAAGTIGAGTQIVWGPVLDLGTQERFSVIGSVSVSADGRKVALMYTIDATGSGNSLMVATAEIDPTSAGATRGFSNVRNRSDSLASTPNNAVASRLMVEMSGDGSTAVGSYILLDNANRSLRSVYYDASAQGAGVASGWQAPVILTPLANNGEQILRLSGDGRTAVLVYENVDLFAFTGSLSGGALTWSQNPVTLARPGSSQQANGDLNLEVTEDGTRGFVTWTVAEGVGTSGAVAEILYVTAVIAGSSSTWNTPAVMSRSDPDPAAPGFSSFYEEVSLVMSDDGATVGVAWDHAKDDGSTYLSDVYLRFGGFSGTAFSWSGPSTLVTGSGDYEYTPRLRSSRDGSRMFLTVEGNGGFFTRVLAVAGGNANWSSTEATPTNPDPVFDSTPSGDRNVMMYVDNTRVGSFLATPSFPVAPTTTTTTVVNGGSGGSGSTPVDPGTLPATGSEGGAAVAALFLLIVGTVIVRSRRRSASAGHPGQAS